MMSFQKIARFVFASTLALTAAAPALASDVTLDGGVPATTAILPLMYGQNLLLKFALSTYGKSDAEKIASMKEAQDRLATFFNEKPYIHRLETQADLTEIKELYFPAFDSLNDEMQYRRSEATPALLLINTDNSEIETELNTLWTQQQARLGALAKIPDAFGLGDQDSANRWLARMYMQRGSNAKVTSGFTNDVARLQFVNAVHTKIAEGLTAIDQTGTLMAGSGALNHADPGFRRFFELAIGEYFRHLSLQAKLDIISTFLDHPDHSSAREKFELMVLSSGPQFQKLFQVYARDSGFSVEMQNVFKQLESNARSTPFRLVKKMLEKENPPFKILSISKKPLGVGTMAQVHKARIRMPDGTEHDVVVRVLKANIAERLAADGAILKTISPVIDRDPILRASAFPLLVPFVNEIIAMGEKELDVPATVAAQLHASSVYNRVTKIQGQTVSFHVPKIYLVSRNSNVMVQEFVPGTSFEKLTHAQPELARGVVNELSAMWIQEALFGGGFYHSDLHQGNLRVNFSSGFAQVNLLDYGMTGTLSSKMQRQILALALVTASNRPDLMGKAFIEIADRSQTTVSADRLSVLIAHEASRRASVGLWAYSFGEWIAFAANAGVKFPPEFTSLNRGLTLIGQMLMNEKSSVTVEELVRRPILRNPTLLVGITKSLGSISRGEWAKILYSASRGGAPTPSGVARPSGHACFDLLSAR